MSNIVNDKVLEYINGYYKPKSTELAEFRADAEMRKIPIILKDTESFLGMIADLSRPKRILEIGTAIGYSAAFLASALPSCRVVTIEREEDAHAEAVLNMERLGLADRVTCLKGDAIEIMAQLADEQDRRYFDIYGDCEKSSAESGAESIEGEPFDFVFIDAGKSHYAQFLECAMKLIGEGALIVCDNVLMKGKTAADEYDSMGKYKTSIRKMRAFMEMITSDTRLDTTIFAVGDGISVSRVNSK